MHQGWVIMRNLIIYRDKGSIDMDIINAFEDKIGFCLPKSYKEIISEHDGLRLVENGFDFVNIYGENDERDLNFLSFLPMDTEYSPTGYYIPIEDFQVSKWDYGIKGLVSFGDCANGDIICFDYRDDPKGCNPKVVLVYHDDYITQEDGTIQMVVNFVANSFEEFMNMLYEYKDE